MPPPAHSRLSLLLLLAISLGSGRQSIALQSGPPSASMPTFDFRTPRASLPPPTGLPCASICCGPEVRQQAFLSQRDPGLDTLPTGGQSLCVPVAIANALTVKPRMGLRPVPAEDGNIQHVRLSVIKSLCGSQGLRVRAGGCYHRDWLPILQRYLAERGVPVAISARGRRRVSPYYSDGAPTVPWLKAAFRKGRAVALATFGTYRKRGHTYRHQQSHTVTLFGLHGTEQDDVAELLLHDPEEGPTAERRVARPIDSGVFVGWVGPAGRNAEGYLTLLQPAVARRRTAKILEDVVVLTFGPHRRGGL